ncbi:MAG: hypothetical protein ACT4PN_00855 [Nitrospiraceae bacterium]
MERLFTQERDVVWPDSERLNPRPTLLVTVHHRFQAARHARRSSRIITMTIIGLAYGIGVIKLPQSAAFVPPITDVEPTVIVVGTLLLAFVASVPRMIRQTNH